MLIALLVFLILGAIVTLLPGAVMGYGCVAVSGSMSLRARIALLLFTAGATAATWLMLSHAWGLEAAILSFAATAASGALFLTIDISKRRAPRRPHPACQVRN
ncbi:hypothetical protein [Streptomyces sp. BF23-19]|uniref:hypothetical protein n=1 Tax=Streptomyces TaxID=1883 RepID=UPI0034E55861|nr:hypothetical protein OG253_40560 [Streptomyces virginiae]